MSTNDRGPDPKAPLAANAKFATGSIMRHILVMTSTSSVGLMAIFLVDFADMYFLSLLGEVEVAAAIGYAGSILFFTTSIGIGLSIAASALVSRAIGSGDMARAKDLALNSYIFTALLGSGLAVIIWLAVPWLLELLGARGRALELATSYLRIIVPTMPILAIGICSAALLRALGDARRSMYVTLSGGIVNAVLDPILIFGADLGVDGAAWASFLSRVAVLAVGVYGVVHVHKLIGKPNGRNFARDLPAIVSIALPAILTNISTPVGNAYITATIASNGDSAVAGWAIIGRIIPVAFGGLFALSGAIGPIMGQNLGALQFDRLQRILKDSLLVIALYTITAWALLAVGSAFIVKMFNATGEAADLIVFFCIWLSPGFAFFGALFAANAAFNNLGQPYYSTMFNWGRATLGTIPFVMIGSAWFGAAGAIAGNMVGGLLFGLLAMFIVFRMVRSLEERKGEMAPRRIRLQRRFPLWPFTTPRG